MRVGVAGILGRVGRHLAAELAATPDDFAGGTVRARPDEAAPEGAVLFTDLASLAACAEVVIDFTHASTTEAHAAILAQAGVAWVLGTTGLSDAAQEAVARAARRIPIVQAANFSPGVTLVTELARRMAASLPADPYDAEILEMHHRQKVDAPSGTALAIGRAVAEGRGVRLPDMRDSGRDGHTGTRRTGAIGFAALRGGQIVGDHSLLFTSGEEQIVLTHRAFDRRVFALGALRAARWLEGRPPGLYGMEDVLGLTG